VHDHVNVHVDVHVIVDVVGFFLTRAKSPISGRRMPVSSFFQDRKTRRLWLQLLAYIQPCPLPSVAR
jgi:hypothetical protein